MFDMAVLTNALAMFHWLRPWWLLLLLPWAAGVWYAREVNDPLAKWQGSIAPHLLRAMLVRNRGQRWFNPVNMVLVVVFLLTIALAGPSWQQRPSPFVADEALLVIGLDLSPSMDQADVQPSRLERAKQKISDLMALRGGARTALVAFAGSAHTVIPLTNDPQVIAHFLAALNTNMMPLPGKFPERVLPLTDSILASSQLPGTLLLLTDGVSSGSEQRFSEYFDQVNHQLLVWGIGAAVSGVEEAIGDIPLQQAQLEQLADISGGYYQPLTIDKTDVQRVQRRIRNHLNRVADSERPWVDAGYYLLWPVALIFLLWFRRGWTLHWGFALLLGGGLLHTPTTQADEWRMLDLWLTPDQQGRYYFEQGDYATAAQRFQNPAWKGLAFYYGENFEAAAEMFSRVDSADGLFNLGNAWAQSQNYLIAVQTYDRLLERYPDYQSARKNRDYVQAIIDEINAMSASQQAEQGEDSTEMSADDPQRADGAERNDMAPAEVKQLSAEEILLDENIQEMWMKQIQQDPSRFLAVKFQMQLERRRAQPQP